MVEHFPSGIQQNRSTLLCMTKRPDIIYYITKGSNLLHKPKHFIIVSSVNMCDGEELLSILIIYWKIKMD